MYVCMYVYLYGLVVYASHCEIAVSDAATASECRSPVCMYMPAYYASNCENACPRSAGLTPDPWCMYTCLCMHQIVRWPQPLNTGPLVCVCMYVCIYMFVHASDCEMATASEYRPSGVCMYVCICVCVRIGPHAHMSSSPPSTPLYIVCKSLC